MESELYSLFMLNANKTISFIGTFSSELFVLDYLKDFYQRKIEKAILEHEAQITNNNSTEFESELSYLSIDSIKRDLEKLKTLSPTQDSLREFIKTISGGMEDYAIVRHRINEVLKNTSNVSGKYKS